MTKPGRALTETEFQKIQRDVFNGLYNDADIDRIFESIRLQRRVLRELFNLFKRDSPMRLAYVADPIRHSSLAYLKELVSMEDSL